MDVDASERFAGRWMEGASPTITCARGITGGYYVSSLQRKLTSFEMARLQGFPKTPMNKYIRRCTPTCINGAIGNAMSCNILERIIPRALWASGLLADLPTDPWEKNIFCWRVVALNLISGSAFGFRRRSGNIVRKAFGLIWSAFGFGRRSGNMFRMAFHPIWSAFGLGWRSGTNSIDRKMIPIKC